MRYYIIAGEASGDYYGSTLIKHIKTLDTNAEFRFWGGDLMSAQDKNLAMHYAQTAFMGFWEVFINLWTIRKLFAFAKRDIVDFKTDKIIFIDYPGFNLRMLVWAKKKGFKCYYYISPQLWAWKENRYKILQKYADELIVIFPFEVDYYKKKGMDVHYFGHPKLEKEISIEHKAIPQNTPLVIAILPGSRKQELNQHLPIIKQLIQQRPKDKFIISIAPGLSEDFINHHKSNFKFDRVNFQRGSLESILEQAHLAIVSSGTATLETAIKQVPQIVIYKTSQLSYLIGKSLIKVPFISIVNLIAGKEIVKELIQDNLHVQSLEIAIKDIINDHEIMIDSYSKLYQKLYQKDSSLRTAKLIVEN